MLRAIAIISVVFAHSAPFLGPLGMSGSGGNAFGAFLSNLYPLGILGVELFFVLSGFLIGGILIRTFVNSEEFTFSVVRHFWVRRWFRTLPAYWLILTVDILLYKTLALTSMDKGKLLFYPFLQNLWYPHPLYFFGEAWSLSIEEWFYLTLPVVMYVCSRLFAPVNRRKFLLRVFVGYLLVFVTARFANAFHPINAIEQDWGIRKVVVFRLDAVMYGVLVAYFSYFSPQLLHKIRKPLLAVSVAGACLVYWLIVSPAVNACDSKNEAVRFFSDAFLYAVIPLIFSLCLPASAGLKKIPGAKVIQHISRISYSMYLVHYSLLFIPMSYYLHIRSHVALIGMYLLYWMVVIVLSSMLYRHFEYPMMNLRDKTAGTK